VAQRLSDRVIAAASIAGAGMLDSPESLEGMNRLNRVVFTLARRAPGALWLFAAPHARQLKRNPAKVIDAAARDKHLPRSDRDVMSNPQTRARMIAAGPEAFRQGVRGFIQEAHVVASPWGFDPSTIKIPVSFWQGTEDTNVPIASVRRLAESIPDSSMNVFLGEGHLIVPKHWDEIVAALLSVGPRSK
jgi:pimeloyl-ACP methyl ester carboxylesterase